MTKIEITTDMILPGDQVVGFPAAVQAINTYPPNGLVVTFNNGEIWKTNATFKTTVMRAVEGNTARLITEETARKWAVETLDATPLRYVTADQHKVLESFADHLMGRFRKNEIFGLRWDLADVRLACGRYALFVAGVCMAVEGDMCRDANIHVDRWDRISLTEAAEIINQGGSLTCK